MAEYREKGRTQGNTAGQRKEENVSWRPPKVGWRMIKTMLAATLIALGYSIWDRNPCFACIGAVFGMGNVLTGGLKSGGNRFIGTIMGGVIALLFYPMYHYELWGIPSWIYLSAGLLILLYIGEMLGAIGGIQPGAVVFYVVILTVPEATYIQYTVNRMIDTGIGVAVALAFDRALPSPKEEAPVPLFGGRDEPGED
ncbi:MAG: FUSC family protein [Lachnospiraceae bacterium]|jgi:uncharacterized membrane protein YgaE (UPF0421/DUF939 family)|nr:FUSC family protein [Lachnospiraceae bacterium]